MDRRAFLRALGVAGVSATVDRKYFFAPAVGGWSSELIVPAKPIGYLTLGIGNGLCVTVPYYSV